MTSVLIEQTILRGFRRAPQAPAVILDRETVSYAELWMRAAQLADVLRTRGVQRGDRVALLLPKGREALVAVYGVLLAEAIYVPLDVRSPVPRLRMILEDADCAAILATPALSAITTSLNEAASRGGGVSRLCVISLPLTASAEEVGDVREVCEDSQAIVGELAEGSHDPAAPAAILYTSGSTGVPKGVVLTHAGLLHFAGWTSRFMGLTELDRVASIAPLQFDLSTFDIFATHRAGAAVVLPEERTLLFPRAVVQTFERHGVTVCYSVPTFWTLLLERGGVVAGGLSTLRHVMFAGEVFPLPALRRLMQVLPHARFTNLFGPLETNVCSLFMLPGIPSEEATEISIGSACPDTVLHVVGEDGKEVGPGEVGELIVRGPSVTPGYWRNPELTRKKRWQGDPGSFRTGDLVTFSPAGEMLFRGRRDHQVKLHGYRIELHEIEQVFQRHDDVRQAVALLCRQDAGSSRLVVVVVRRAGLVSADALREFAAAHLAPWSQPTLVVFRDRFPITVTGKTDRLQLQADVEANEIAGNPRCPIA